MDPVVSADGVAKRYGETVALDGVSLSIATGEVFGLIGPNGAGKTTLVRSLTGTVEPDAGTVRLFGSTPESVDPTAIGVLPQAFSPPARLTVDELVRYYASLYPDSRDPDAVVDAVGLGDSTDTWYENLSGGQQRRLCVGTTLLNDPDLLVLDEPTTGIDPAGRRTIWELIESLAERGTAVLLTTHDMAEAERLADRVGLLADGRLLDVGTPATLVDDHTEGASVRIEIPDIAPARASEEDEGAPDPSSIAASIEDRVVRPVTARAGALTVHDVEATAIGSIVETLESLEVRYTELDWAEPGLEEVYLALLDDPTDAGAWAADGRDTAPAPDGTDTTDDSVTVDTAAGGERR
ncbi:ABC transporter ATP-binding protein [Halovivax limisalsi]|uniref:ABC transporter ATP-binding protein n=1 Tax=Halovivax limisalsi TaxID=1453760 RepID=UPI001FFDC836|nr:ABC transporter ATP-binding protein [Halovivax limisalsi]